MRGSAPQTLEYGTKLNALPLIGPIRWLGGLFTEKTGASMLISTPLIFVARRWIQISSG
jgi:hypothetical protein